MTDPLLGSVVQGRYRIDRLLARGGMGAIYLAEQVPLGRAVALKVLVPSALRADNDGELRRRFLREAETCAKLRHPNTVVVFDYGTLPLAGGEGEGLFIAMEYVAGRTLGQALREDGRFDPARVSAIAVQVARSLREAHAAGIVHRDLKPGNVMLTPGSDDERETVKVLDFGVAKVLGEAADGLTVAGSFVGSPRYASPEQIQELDVDGRSDLYSLGVVMYELLSGTPPFQANDTIRMLMAHVRDAPPPLRDRVEGVPAELAELVHALLEKDPARRPADADGVIQALRGAATGKQPAVGDRAAGPALDGPEPISLEHPTWSAGTKPANRRAARAAWPFALVGAGALVGIAVCAGLAWFAWPAAEPPVVVAPPPEVAPVEVPRLELSSAPPGATVTEAGVALGQTPLMVALDHERRVHVELDGYEPVDRVLTAGDTDLALTLEPKTVKPKRPTAPHQAPAGDGIRTSR